MAYAFTVAHKRNKPPKGDWGGDWGQKILKDAIRAAQTKSYKETSYIGNGVVLTRIIYEALGMKYDFKEMPRDQVFLETLEEKREETHQELGHKALVEGQEKMKEAQETILNDRKVLDAVKTLGLPSDAVIACGKNRH